MKIDLGKYAKQYEKELEKRINESTVTLLWDVIQKSPVDTWEYLKWNKRQLAKKEGNKIVWVVYNDSDNAENVEEGWGAREVKRHKSRRKWWPVIHEGTWAKVYLRAYLEKRDEIKNNLTKKILW